MKFSKGWASLFFTLIFCCSSSSVFAALSTASLNGAYRFISQGSSFWKYTGGEGTYVYDVITGETGRIIFDGAGHCSVTWDEKEFEVGFAANNNTVQNWTDTGGPESCTYTLAASGQGQLKFTDDDTETLWASADAGTLIMGGGFIDAEEDGTDYDVDQLVAVREGTALDASVLNGTYHFVSKGKGFWKYTGGIDPQVHDNISGETGTITFNGAGGCSVTWDEKEFEVGFTANNTSVQAWTDSGGPEVCTYTLSSSGVGQLQFPDDDNETFWVSADGNTLLMGGAFVEVETDGTDYEADQLVAVKAATVADATILNGTYRFVQQGSSFWNYTSGGSYVFDNLFGGTGTITFDGAGKCTAAWADKGFEVGFTAENDTVELWPDDGVEACTYSIADNGEAQLSFGDDDPAVFWVSPTGNTIIMGGGSIQEELEGTSYDTEQLVAVLTVPRGPALPVPVSIGFPVSEGDDTWRLAPIVDADGSYRISWLPAATTPAGVTYVVEEATNSTFTAGVQTIYEGSETSTSVGERAVGTYYYRVKLKKPGFKDSAWKSGGAMQVIGISVKAAAPAGIKAPPGDVDGTYIVSWKKSATKGVTYIVEESTNPSFTSAQKIYEGTALNTALSGRQQLLTYYYRVKAVHPEYAHSAWRESTVGCAVPGVRLLPPVSITAPASDDDGAYDVNWGASPSTGVTYVLEEATNAAFTLGRREAYRGEGLSAAIIGRTPGMYYYRVKAVAAGYRDSAWKKPKAGCKIIP